MRTSTSAMAPAPAPLEATATKIDSSRITRTSSTTAAPNSAIPSLLRSTPSSSSVCALMLTLVAVRIMPTKRAAWPW